MTAEALAPFDIAQVVARLREQVPELREVGGAAESAAAFDNPTVTPAAYVVLASEAMSTDQFTELGRVTAAPQIDVLLVVRNYRLTDRGQAHAEAARPLAGKIRAALNGWRPTAVTGQQLDSLRSHGRAQTVKFDKAVYWWLEPFTTESRSRI